MNATTYSVYMEQLISAWLLTAFHILNAHENYQIVSAEPPNHTNPIQKPTIKGLDQKGSFHLLNTDKILVLHESFWFGFGMRISMVYWIEGMSQMFRQYHG